MMNQYTENILKMLNEFYKATGIGVLFFNTVLNLVEFSPSSNPINDFFYAKISQNDMKTINLKLEEAFSNA